MKKSIMRIAKLIVVFVVMLITTIAYLPLEKIAATNINNFLALEVNTTTPTILTGEEIRLNVKYSFSSLTSEYKDVKLVLTVPTDIVSPVLSASNMPIVYSDGISDLLVPTITGNKITYTIPANKTVEAGYAGIIELIKIKTNRFVTLPQAANIAVELSGHIDGEVKTLTEAEPVNVNVTPSWKLNKTAQFPIYNENTYARFRMFIQAPNQNGNLAANGFSVTDTLPSGVQFVAFDDPTDPNINTIFPNLNPNNNATWGSSKPQPFSNNTTNFPAGSVTQNANTITWTVPNSGKQYNNDSYLELSFWVKIDPNVLGNDETKTITNTGEMKVNLINNSELTGIKGDGSLLVIEDVGETQSVPEKSIYFTDGGYGLDTNTVYFNLKASSFYNKSSTIDVTNFVVSDTEDNWSPGLTLKELRIPTMETGNDAKPYLVYSVEFLRGTTILRTDTGTTATSRTLTAPSGSTGYRLKMNEIPRGTGASGSNIKDIAVGFTLTANKLKDTCIFNRADFSYAFDGNNITVSKSSGCQPLSPTGAVRMTLSKSVDNKKAIYQYDDLVNYSISYSNSTFSGKAAEGVIIYDLLPKELRFVPGSVVGNVDVIDVVENFNGTGQQRVQFKVKTAVNAGTTGTIKFNAYVTENVKTLSYTNAAYLVADTPIDSDFNYSSFPKDTNDIDQDGNVTEGMLSATTNIDAAAFSSVLIIKEVKGDLDTTWSRYPEYGRVSGGGQFQYRLTIKNYAPSAMSQINVVDILPHVGDTGVLMNTARDTQWTPVLKAPIVPAPGLNVEYSTSYNPNRGPIGKPLLGETSTNWAATAPSDITSVKSLKFNYAGQLAAGASFSFTYDMISPVGAPTGGEIAWNSFGMQARNTSSNTLTAPVEPKKVGIKTAVPTRPSILGRTWVDKDVDGWYDDDEVGLNGVKVYLFYDDTRLPVLDSNGNPAFTVTANDVNGDPGHYIFMNLTEWTKYFVKFEPLPGFGASPPIGYNEINNRDRSDYDPLTWETWTIELQNQDRDDIDGGFTAGRIGDFIFDDLNNNGIQDVGEPGIPNVTLKLLKDNVVVATTTTNSSGYYIFEPLPVGEYQVEFQKPILYNFAPSFQGSDPAKDSNFTPINLQNARSNIIDIQFDTSNMIYGDLTIDGGMNRGNSSLSGTVWDDLKRDDVYGNKPAGGAEDIVANVPVFLYNSEGVLIANTITDASGNYQFTGLSSDNYVVELTPPSGLSLVAPNVGSNAAIDSDFIIATKKTNPIAVGYNTNVTDIDAGLYSPPTGKIKGNAYVDDNKDCTRQETEFFFAGLTVKLIDADTNAIIQTTITDYYGNYEFNNVPAGNYKIRMENSASAFNIGTPPSTFETIIVLQTNNTEYSDFPTGGACLQYKSSSLGNYVWLDQNRDGLQTFGEPGLPNVELILYSTANVELARTTSDSNGYYNFSNVSPNQPYYIIVNLPSNDYRFTIFNAPSVVENSLAEPITDTQGRMVVVPLSPDTSNTFYDVGVVYTPSSIGDYVFLDIDENGLQDVGEYGLKDIKLDLYQIVDTVETYIASDVTDSSGNYLFNNLNPGTYRVKIDASSVPGFLTPAVYSSSQGLDDSDFHIDTLQTEPIILAAGSDRADIDAGLEFKDTNIGDVIWIDENRNGLQDGTEAAVPDVSVYLYQEDALGNQVQVSSTVTGADGRYEFIISTPYTYAADGTYTPNVFYLKFDVPPTMMLSDKYQVGLDVAVDNDFKFDSLNLPATTPITIPFTEVGKDNFSFDGALEYQYSSIGNYVWLDANRNGMQDNDELPMEGILVELLKFDGQNWLSLGTKTTGADGKYLFDQLDPGIYKAKLTLGAMQNLTSYRIGGDDVDNDFCPQTQNEFDYANVSAVDCEDVAINETRQITLGADTQFEQLDAGIQEQFAEVGDFIWLDSNRNGVQDVSEVGQSNVSVRLIDEAGNVVMTTTTDLLGNYQFRKVESGMYHIEIVVPNGYELTEPLMGSDIGKDSDFSLTTSQTALFSLQSGDKNPTFDGGLKYQLSSIGDYVFFDTNENGLQDGGETGIANVTMQLTDGMGHTVLDGFGQPVADVMTDSNGLYQFMNLNPGNYTVKAVLTTEQSIYYDVTLHNIPSDDLVDSDFLPTLESDPINLLPHTTDTSVDLGLKNRRGSIGGYTWIDSDRDGIQQDVETPLGSVNVTLYRIVASVPEVVGTQATLANGTYLFENLEPQFDYYVKMDEPTDYDVTLRYVGAPEKDSDIDQVTGMTQTVTLANGQNIRGLDGGYVYPYAILGDYVWMDKNQNGLQDVNEPPVPNVEVRLLDEQGNALADGNGVSVAYTDAAGYYTFVKLHGMENYQLQFVLPSQYSNFTMQGMTLNDNTDSNVDATGKTALIYLTTNEHNLTIDAGLVPKPASIGDYVWLDTNKDGIQNGAETGIPNITVTLIDELQHQVVTTTDSSGNYQFDQLVPGNYCVSVSLPQQYDWTLKNAGTDPMLDANFDAQTMQECFAIGPDEHNHSIDAGMVYKEAMLGNYIWFDTNEDGMQQIGENGLADIKVVLKNSDGTDVMDVYGNPVLPVMTLSNGAYQFTKLKAGTYYVMLELTAQQAIDYQMTLSGQGVDVSIDSDFVSEFSSSETTLDHGEYDGTLDLGLIHRRASIGNYTWIDSNKNGIQDEGETTLAGVEVKLYKVDGANLVYVATQITDAFGLYQFNNLAPQMTYQLHFNLPMGYDRTLQYQGGDNTKDSDADLLSGWTGQMTVTNGEVNQTIDAGYIYPGSIIGDYVFMDTNENGLQDLSEPGVAGVLVELLDEFDQPIADGNGATQKMTDAAGYYQFEKLNIGKKYKIKVTLPAAYAAFTVQGTDLLSNQDSNVDAQGMSPEITLGFEEHNLTIDAGLIPKKASIGDYIWYDTNKNGLQDEGEFGIPQIMVKLYDQQGVLLDMTMTDAAGNYHFNDLVTGMYKVEVVKPTKYEWTAHHAGNVLTDSDFDAMHSMIDVTLLPDEHNASLDAGLFYQEGKIGNYVFFDANENGLQDEGETGIPQVTLSLWNQDGTPAVDVFGQPILSSMTDSMGYYEFVKLAAGTYVVKVELTAEQLVYYQPTLLNQGGDDSLDSDLGDTMMISGIMLTDGQIDSTQDIGFINKRASVGNYTWIDSNKNGVQDEGETTLAGVEVKLYRVEDNVDVFIGTQTTDAFGTYLFEQLDPTYMYRAHFSVPSVYDHTVALSGTDNTIDSDADLVTGFTQLFGLTNGTLNDTIDAGYIFPGSLIGDYVWIDYDQNGLQDTNEPGLAGVQVELLDEFDQLIADGNGATMKTTDAAGYYQFEKLTAGITYKIRVILPAAGYSGFTMHGADMMAIKDSNVNAQGVTQPITLGVDEQNLSIDAGLIMIPASIGDYIWHDENGNGMQDATENGIAGVRIELEDGNGNTYVQITDSNGGYQFTNLPAGEYCVTAIKPAAYTWSLEDADSPNNNKFSNKKGKYCFKLGIGENRLDVDGGLVREQEFVNLSTNTVCQAEDESSQVGLAGVRVRLTMKSFVPQLTPFAIDDVYEAVSDANGQVNFTNLANGTYLREIVEYPAIYREYLGETIEPELIVVKTNEAGEVAMDPILMKIQRCFEFGNRVWVDSNKNGVQDQGETGMNDIQVLLYDEFNQPVLLTDGTQKQSLTMNQSNFEIPQGSTYALENGLYRLRFDKPGRYKVKVVLPEGYQFTTKNSGGNDDIDSDIDPATGMSDLVEMTPDVPWFYHLDVGVYNPSTITPLPDGGNNLVATGQRIQELIAFALFTIILSVGLGATAYVYRRR